MFLLIISLFWGLSTVEAQTSRGEAINLYVENDSRNIGGPGVDKAYSNGVKLSFVAAENDIPSWAKPMINRSETFRKALKGSQTNFGIAIGQQIYTPTDTKSTELIPDDRPYAGWLYLGMSAQFKSEQHSHSLELDIGIIGPESGAEKIQNGFHKIIGVEGTYGWKNQLATEPTVEMSYQQRLQFFELVDSNKKKYFDVIPFFGGALGNVSIDAHAGSIVRFGIDLPDDFGPTRPSSIDGDNFVPTKEGDARKTRFYVFASGRGIAVGRNIFLDGNTFKSSHRVTKYPFILETEIGFVAVYSHLSLAWRFVTRSPEFEQRSTVNSFASISIGYTF
ncbi:MAG: lipid A deacylase LpxR family protein [Bdellovibrionaceae bacterium]|nr:lipid A deacylase LpxR family protein [Pseudobdellovibrionaceae bacterium]